MEILDYVERDLNSHYYDNIIYFLTEEEKEKYIKIRELLEKDYGYLDIVLDFDDYYKLKPLFDKLPKDEIQRKVMKNMIISDYLNYSILSKAGIEINRGVSVSKIGEALFSGDLKKYIDNEDLFFNYDVCEPIEKLAEKTTNKKARIHFILNNVKDKRLQQNINDLFVYRCDIAMMGYTTKELLTYHASNGEFMQDIHDYTSILSDNKRKRLIRGGM